MRLRALRNRHPRRQAESPAPTGGRCPVLRESFGYKTHVLGPAELREEIASPRYHGGLLDPGAGGLHPGRYVRGLAAAAERAGATLAEGAEVRE